MIIRFRNGGKNKKISAYEQNGFYVDAEKKGRHPLHHAGAFYMQEPSAMFTINSIKFKGDENVFKNYSKRETEHYLTITKSKKL